MTTKMLSPTSCAKPFLKWAGGKSQIIKKLISYLPKDFHNRTYHEPFLGAGSLFFAMKPQKAFLSDANEHLIRCYEYVRENPKAIYKYLQHHRKYHSKKYYYQIRDEYNLSSFSAAQAARFIYLNKACYNGIFRVNKSGRFNVPYGRNKTLGLSDLKELEEISILLKKANISALDYNDTINNINAKDFIYIDPPYPPLNGTSNFTHYTPDKFNSDDQTKLAQYVQVLNDRGCLFMLSNADVESIRNLYSQFYIYDISVTRFVTCKKKRHKVKEVIITNYPRS